jgi:hypothetical protein
MKHKKRSPAYPLLPNMAEYCVVNNKKKRKYATQLDAELAAPVKELQQYVCEFCGYWHNGNSLNARQHVGNDLAD